MINSISLALSSLPIPKGDYHGAMGNNVTCSMQGFFVQLGTAVPYYNASICLFAYMTILHKYTTEQFSLTIEPYCHALAILFPLLTAFVVLALNGFHGGNEYGGGHWCWIYINPSHDSYEDSISSRYATALAWLFAGVPVGLVSLAVFFFMGRVYMHVRMHNRMVRRDNALGRVTSTMNIQTAQTARQALFYSMAFVVSFFPIDLDHILTLAGLREDRHPLLHPILRVFQSTFFPLQGFWNFIIYFNPIILGMKRRYPDISSLRAFQLALTSDRQTRPQTNTHSATSFPLPVIHEMADRSKSPLDLQLVDCVNEGAFSISNLSDPTMEASLGRKGANEN